MSPRSLTLLCVALVAGLAQSFNGVASVTGVSTLRLRSSSAFRQTTARHAKKDGSYDRKTGEWRDGPDDAEALLKDSVSPFAITSNTASGRTGGAQREQKEVPAIAQAMPLFFAAITAGAGLYVGIDKLLP
jgi:hypothetical protein